MFLALVQMGNSKRVKQPQVNQLVFIAPEIEIFSVEELKTKHDILIALGKVLDVTEVNKLKMLELKSRELLTKVYDEEKNILEKVHIHEIFSLGVTLLSIAIALCGMSVVSKRKLLWGGGLVVGAVGIILYGLGFFKMIS